MSDNPIVNPRAQKAYCVWCGREGVVDTDDILDHVRVCEKHPLRAEITRLRRVIAEAPHGMMCRTHTGSALEAAILCRMPPPRPDELRCDCWKAAVESTAEGEGNDG